MYYWLLNTVNIYDEEANGGTSVIPFLGFVLLVASMIIILIAVANIVTIQKDYRLYYERSALDEKPDPAEKKRKIKKHAIILAVGIVLFILSHMITWLL